MKKAAFFAPLWLVCLVSTARGQATPPPSPPTPPPSGPTQAPPPAREVDETPVSDFPGQYAPRPAGEKFPVFSKGCERLEAVLERLACTNFVLADWPRLSRYAAANAAVAPARAGERRVVFFGDSITDNWSKKGYGGFFPGKPYLNRGIGGQTTGQMLVRFRPDVIALKPAVVVILAGTNDVARNSGLATPESIQDNLTSITDLARAAGIRVVLASLLPVTDEKKGSTGAPIIRSRDRPPEALRALNRWMAEFARRKGYVYLDYETALLDTNGSLRVDLTDDGLHPNAAGYAVMAPLAERAIARALGRAAPVPK
jgi:lysophospholipase L1-like esterase